MVSFFIIAALWPIATSLALPCAEQPVIPGMTCNDLPHHPDVKPAGVLVNDRLRIRNLTDEIFGAYMLGARQNDDTDHFKPADADLNVCSDSLFYDYDYEHPPRSDCEAVETWARENKGLWDLGLAEMPATPAAKCLVQSGSCAFCIRVDPNMGSDGVADIMLIGNQDVADIVHDALADDQDGNDTTGARGYVGCQTVAKTDESTLSWWIVSPEKANDLDELRGW